DLCGLDTAISTGHHDSTIGRYVAPGDYSCDAENQRQCNPLHPFIFFQHCCRNGLEKVAVRRACYLRPVLTYLLSIEQKSDQHPVQLECRGKRCIVSGYSSISRISSKLKIGWEPAKALCATVYTTCTALPSCGMREPHFTPKRNSRH